MLAQSTPSILAQWQLLAVAFIGVASAGLTLLLGVILAGRRRRSQLLPPSKDHQAPPDPFVFGSATEKRTSLRRRGNPVRVMLTEDGGTGEAEEAWVLDR